MLTGATSLDLVRDELFTSIGEVEDLLQQFLEDRHNGSLMQRAIEGLQQLRGTLDLIELNGAALLLGEMVELATDIPEHEGTERNAPLSALCDSLFLLERYLEQCRHLGGERPQLLLPLINELRAHRQAPALPENHFYPLPVESLGYRLEHGASASLDVRTFNRLRQMYQVGLLGLLREEPPASVSALLQRALQRWQAALDRDTATLCWVASAALEAVELTPLSLNPERKRLFAQVDRQVKKSFVQPGPMAPALLQGLLYLVALGTDQGPLGVAVRSAFQLNQTGYSEAELQQAFTRLHGPGVDVMRSVAEALREEIAAIKDLLDLLARNAGDTEQTQENLGLALQRLWKTLGMLELHQVATAVESVSTRLDVWQTGDMALLEEVADAVLQAETAVNRLDGQSEGLRGGHVRESVSEPVELKEARIVLIEESQAGLALARRAITAYMESGHDSMHLLNVPASLETVRGGLIFLGMTRAANIIHLSARFIAESMLERRLVPQPQQLDVLADALTGVEFYLESAERSALASADVLTLAEDSLAELGYTVSEV